MKIVWDEAKAASNQKKHGITFTEAQSVFYDSYALLINDQDHSENEERFILLGLSFVSNMLVVCHCYREKDEQLRIISARKATNKETAQYVKRK